MKIIYFIEDGLSCTSILRTVKEEVDCCFDIMTKKKTKKKQKQKQKKNPANLIYAILKVISKLVTV